jgi:prophage regulatory protein
MNHLLSRKEVLKITSLSRATLFRLEREGRFPKAVPITDSRVAYSAEDVDAWIERVLSGKEAQE